MNFDIDISRADCTWVEANCVYTISHSVTQQFRLLVTCFPFLSGAVRKIPVVTMRNFI